MLIVMRCTYALNRPRCILLLLEENKRPWAKAVHAEPSPLVINNIPWPLKAQRCESFLLNHCSHSCNRSVSGLCVAKPSQTLIMRQKTCNRTIGSALVFTHDACEWYWLNHTLLVLADIYIKLIAEYTIHCCVDCMWSADYSTCTWLVY